RDIGNHPDDGEIVQASIGPYGAYIRHGKVYANIPNIDEIFDIGMNRAIEELAKKLDGNKNRTGNSEPISKLGAYPEKGGSINVMEGRYGPYVKWEKINATIPKEIDPKDVTLDIAIKLLEEKVSKKPSKAKVKKRKAKPKKK
ncbi:MAG: DNA topoisomerase-1, partial [Paracoccaceae bacterium]